MEDAAHGLAKLTIGLLIVALAIIFLISIGAMGAAMTGDCTPGAQTTGRIHSECIQAGTDWTNDILGIDPANRR